MKILNADQIRQVDAYTIKNEPISSVALMERAATACVYWIIENYDSSDEILVVCGTGNNGGDGLVITRQLKNKGYQVRAGIIRLSDGSDDFNTNLNKLDSEDYFELKPDDSIDAYLENADVLIDCLFGTGLSRPVTGWPAGIIESINNSLLPVVSIDLPSGLYSEDNSKNNGAIVQSNITLTFQTPKLALLLSENAMYVQRFVILDIGLDEGFIESLDSDYFFTTSSDIYLTSRGRFDHKGNFGRILLVAGSKGKMGACVLAARACVRSGAGLVTLHIPECGYPIVQTAVPEAMALSDKHLEQITTVNTNGYDVIGIGPGIGTNKQTEKGVLDVIDKAQTLVLDADAINILSENKDFIKKLPPNTILTPHVKEFERLVGTCKTGFERLQKQIEFSVENKVIVVLKGAHTSVSLPDGSVHFNSTGNPYMATGGSGDVLTGIITALRGQTTPEQAAIMGVYIHGQAGDIAHEERGIIIASDIIDCL